MNKPPFIVEVKPCRAQQRRRLGQARPANQIEVRSGYRLAGSRAQLHDQQPWAGCLKPGQGSVEMRIAFRCAPARDNEIRVKAIMDSDEIAARQTEAPQR